MICEICGKQIPGFDVSDDITDICDCCLVVRFKDDPRIKDLITKPVEQLTEFECSDILDTVYDLQYETKNFVCNRITERKK